MQPNKQSKKNLSNNHLQEVSQLLAEAFIRMQEKSIISGDCRDNLVDLPATPSIHADSGNDNNIEV